MVIPQIAKAEALHSDCLMSYLRHLLGGGLTSLQRCCLCILKAQPIGLGSSDERLYSVVVPSNQPNVTWISLLNDLHWLKKYNGRSTQQKEKKFCIGELFYTNTQTSYNSSYFFILPWRGNWHYHITSIDLRNVMECLILYYINIKGITKFQFQCLFYTNNKISYNSNNLLAPLARAEEYIDCISAEG